MTPFTDDCVPQDGCLQLLLDRCSRDRPAEDFADIDGNTPAHLAARNGHLTCLQVRYRLTSGPPCGATVAALTPGGLWLIPIFLPIISMCLIDTSFTSIIIY